MLDWLFGSKKQEKKQNKEEQLEKDQLWIYDYIRQYLTSPIWRNPILDFIEENCSIFQDTEENKFEYTKIFQQFTGLTALLLQSMIQQIGIQEKTLQKCIIKGIKSEKDSKIFQQILLCDNFLSFKRLMVSKNKELQVQVLQKLHKQSKVSSKSNEKQLQIDVKQLERLQIEKAIAMSLALQQKTQEEKQLEQAIKMSQQQYHIQEQKRKETQKKPKETIKLSALGSLPPLVIGSNKANRPIQDFKIQQNKLKEQIEVLRKKQQQRRQKEDKQTENAEQRKKRLLEQRQLLKKRKAQERQIQLNTFVSNQQLPNAPEKTVISEQELQRRKNLMKKLKEQLKQ